MNMADINLVLVYPQDIGRDALRDILRRCGLKSVRLFSACNEMIHNLKGGTKVWNVLIVDSKLPGALDAVRTIREMFGAERKILVVFSGPTREEVLEAVQAGANDFLTLPFSQATIEEKLRKVMGDTSKPAAKSPGSIFQRKL